MNRTVLALLTVFSILSGQALLHADNINGPLSAAIDLSAEPGALRRLDLGIEEIAAVSPGADLRFYKALEISLQLPEAVRDFGDSFALFIYAGISPSPSAGITSYRGTRLLFTPFLYRKNLYIQIPFRDGEPLEVSPDTVNYDGTLGPDSFPVLATVLPIMKGIPAQLQRIRFPLTARLVPTGMGAAAIGVKTADGKMPGSLRVLLNGKEFPADGSDVLMKPGIYNLTVSAADYREERRSFTVEAAKVTSLTVELMPATAGLFLDAPADASVFIDGEKLDHGSGRLLNLAEGPHSLVLKYGDYRLTRKFTAIAGKTYRISLFLDILIKED